MMKCHYEVLGVSREASEDELKKAYKSMALKCHPDKNRDNPEEATKRFHLVQSAYAVLSDPQERAWYDNHREAILRGGTGVGGEHEEGIDVMPYFSPSAFTGFGDDMQGFYSVYARLFKQISEDEIQNGDHEEDEAPEAPEFGDSTASYERVVRPFYAYWENFQTHRGFHGQDKWDLREAEDRRVKRLMEKENKKLRDASRKEYNLTIRELAAYVKKRDKRVQQYLARRREEQEQKEKLEKERKLESSRKGKVVTHSVLDADHQHGLAALESHIDSMFGVDPDEQELEGGMFCPACGKAFKSAKQWDNHKRSKKHLAAVARLKEVLEVEDLAQAGDGHRGDEGNDIGGEDEVTESGAGAGAGDGDGVSANAAAAAAAGSGDVSNSESDQSESEARLPSRANGDGAGPAIDHDENDPKDTLNEREAGSASESESDEEMPLRTAKGKKKGKKKSTAKERKETGEEDVPRVSKSQKKKKAKKTRRAALSDDDDDDDDTEKQQGNGKEGSGMSVNGEEQVRQEPPASISGAVKEKQSKASGATQDQDQEQQHDDDEEATLAAMLGRLGPRSRGSSSSHTRTRSTNNQGDDDDDWGRETSKTRGRRKGKNPYEPVDADDVGADEDEDDGAEDNAGKKAKGKKAREAKRAQQSAKVQAEFDAESSWTCHVCAEVFNTRNKLFQHVNELGHALRKDEPPLQSRKGKKGK